ncbi:MAG: electron transfer flavoprotein subunit beta/FixA family protein [Cetobacterium sp.]
MKIFVSFKLIPDFDMFSENDWIISSHFQVDTSYIKKIINPYDESSLEIALKLKDKSKEEMFLTALTIGSKKNEMFLKSLLALKYNKVIKMETEKDFIFNSNFISNSIATYAKENPQDIYLMGSQSPEGDNGKTPYLLAEILKIPCISNVSNVEKIDDTLEVTSYFYENEIKLKIKPPVILVIGNSPISYLRIPTLKDKISTNKEKVDVIDLDNIELTKNENSKSVLKQIFRERFEKNPKICEIEDIEELFTNNFKELLK